MKRAALFLSLCCGLAHAQFSGVTRVGHEFRQDDLPAIAAAPDGSIWAAWLSFVGDRDDVAIRQYKDGKWGSLQWVPNTSGDSWLPQVGVDLGNRVWVVWSQMAGGNWDIYARRFDPAKQEWSALERLTSDPMPDINPRLASDGKGRVALVWQGFRGKNSNIFLKWLDGEQWSADMRVTNRPVNDWEPAVALDASGNAWVAYDSYKNGNYDVMLSRVTAAGVPGSEMAVAATARFEARATVAVDTANRVWVAWEAGMPNWGKDQGYILRDRRTGVPLGAAREPRIKCYDNGQWRDPAAALATAYPTGNNTYQPHVFSDGQGSVFVAAKTRLAGQQGNRGWWEYRLTRLEGGAWMNSATVPHSMGRSSTRIQAALGSDGALWMAWDTDGRRESFLHRPIQQQVHAGKLMPPRAPAPVWGQAPVENLTVAAGHADEAGDLNRIRSYTATVGGKKLNIVRGDFHRHTELSWDGGGSNDGSLQDFYRYMIDAGSMDFGASTDHQGGAWPYWWWYTQKMTDMYHVPGAYVPIFGYERSAVFPNGHRNMFFAKRSESRVTPFHLKAGAAQFGLGQNAMGDEPGIGSGELVENDTKLLYEEIRRLNGIAISHTSGTRMGTDWRDNDPELEPVVEIFQGARTSYEQLGFPYVVVEGKDDAHMKQAGYQPQGMVNLAWAKGYKLGIITSSDHGSTHISYAMVYTDNPTRQGVLDGIRKRHTYGATDNMILDVRMGPHFMGDEFPLTKAAPLKVKARGTRAVVRVDIIKDNQVIYTAEPKKQDVEFEYVDKGEITGRHFYYVRLMQDDGMIAWSSPMFINYK
ncbi:MAG: hypothetical protein FJW20_07355 [Acidimicrobiia bacterium]|nr:hypothetical protein [Acidimicrobiia bacterium]